MTSPWSGVVWRFVFIISIGVIAGLLLQQVWMGIAFALSYCLWTQLRQLHRLESWLNSGKKEEVPDITGVWGEIYYYFSRMYLRNQSRKRRLTSLLNRFQKSTAALPDATVVLESQGEILWWNEAAIKVIGLQPSDRGQRIDNLIRFPAFHTFLNKGEYDTPIQIPSSVNENLTLNIRIVPYGKDQRLLVARDITHMLNLEQMRQDFVGNVSHELRTPLTVIRGYLDTLVDTEEEGSLGGSLLLMQEQTARMQTIVEDLLLLSRLESESHSSMKCDSVIMVGSLITQLVDDAKRVSGGKHKIKLELDNELKIYGVESWLFSAFSNLLFNAIRYTPDGGEITVKWYQDSSGAYFSVRDTGIGFSQSHIPRLTERFYRVDVARSRDSGGTGLGLAIVKHVLQLHQAKLYVESMPGKGSLFRCEFPLQRVVAEKRAVKQQL